MGATIHSRELLMLNIRILNILNDIGTSLMFGVALH